MSTKGPTEWRVAANIYLKKREPHLGEAERWETGICGSVRVVLAKSKNMQWSAVVADGLPAYSDDPYEALAAAQHKAIDSCNYRLFKIQEVEFYDS